MCYNEKKYRNIAKNSCKRRRNVKSVKVLKFLLLALVIVLAIMTALLFFIPQAQNSENDDQTDNENALGVALTAVFAILIWFVSALPSAIALLITDICLFAVKKKFGAAIACLVVMCLTAPVLGVNLVVYIEMCVLIPKLLVAPIVTALLWLATFVTCCVAVAQLRKERTSAVAA